MRFHELPLRLRLYILAHPVVLAPLMVVALRMDPPKDWWLVALLLLFTVVFSTWKVELTIFQARMTPTFAVVCLALLLRDVQAAIVCAAVGAIVGILVRPETGSRRIRILRPPAYRLLFNIGNCMLSCITASLIYHKVIELAPGGGVEVVLGLTAFTATYFAINTFGVSLAIAFQQRLPWFSVWQQNFLWTAPGFFASASAAAGIHMAYDRLKVWALFFLPPLYLIYYSYRLYMERIHLYSDKVEQDMTHIQELNKLNQAIIASLATAIDAKDSYTCSHINRVQQYAVALARAAGVTGPELEAVATGALVHDIGKLGIPDHILGKPGKLAPEEFTRIQRHVTIGTEILSPIPFPFPVLDVVRTHHERWDGLGYPQGLRGEDIPLGGRIISIVDVFDALTSDRPYRRALSQEEALKILMENAGKQFDPRLVGLFETVLPQVSAEIEQMEAKQRVEGADASLPKDGASALAQISQAAAEMAAVCDVAHSLAEQETLDQISAVVVNRALALLPADTAVLYVRGADETDLVAAAVEGRYRDKLSGMTIQIGEGVAGWVAREQQPRVNVSAALDIARRFSPEETMELSAATAVPLVVSLRESGAEAPEPGKSETLPRDGGPESCCLGVLAVYTLGYSVLTEHHLHVLNILAEHAAAAIQNSRRFERQRELAYTDPLTGLANSRNLVRHLERLTYGAAPGDVPGADPPGPAGAAGQLPEGPPHALRLTPPFSVIMLDLDRFKEVNDTLGHLKGDELLLQVAQTLSSIARAGDVVCRYAGDEFVLLLPRACREQAEGVAARVRETVDAIPAVDGRVKIGTSVGVATFPHDGTDGRTLLHVADQRMYEDKFHRRQSLRSGLAATGDGRSTEPQPRREAGAPERVNGDRPAAEVVVTR